MGLYYRIEILVFALVCGGVLAVLGYLGMLSDGDMRRRDAWLRWATAHCQIVSVSAGGFWSPSIVHYRCDDHADHLSRNDWTPDTWNP